MRSKSELGLRNVLEEIQKTVIAELDMKVRGMSQRLNTGLCESLEANCTKIIDQRMGHIRVHIEGLRHLVTAAVGGNAITLKEISRQLGELNKKLDSVGWGHDTAPPDDNDRTTSSLPRND